GGGSELEWRANITRYAAAKTANSRRMASKITGFFLNFSNLPPLPAGLEVSPAITAIGPYSMVFSGASVLLSSSMPPPSAQGFNTRSINPKHNPYQTTPCSDPASEN